MKALVAKYIVPMSTTLPKLGRFVKKISGNQDIRYEITVRLGKVKLSYNFKNWQVILD